MLTTIVSDSLKFCKDLEETRESVLKFVYDESVPRTAKFIELSAISRTRTSLFLNSSISFHVKLLNDCFEIMFDENLNIDENITCFQWFFQCDSRLDSKPELEIRFQTYFRNRHPRVLGQEHFNLLDIFKTNRPGLFEIKRDLMNRPEFVNNANNANNRQIRTYYRDSQSVHNPGVQRSFKDSAAAFDPNETANFENVLREIKSVCSSHKAIQSLERIEIDVSELNIANLLCNVWKRIKSSEHRSELTKRLMEELEEMNGKCSSGIATRIVNVLSGFDDEIGIKIDITDEIFAIWNLRLKKVLQNDESLMDGFVDGNEMFTDWLISFKDQFFADMKLDYENLFTETFSVESLREVIDKL